MRGYVARRGRAPSSPMGHANESRRRIELGVTSSDVSLHLVGVASTGKLGIVLFSIAQLTQTSK